MTTFIGFDVDWSSIMNFIVLYYLFTVIFPQMTSTEEITVIDVGEKEGAKMSQNTEMSENVFKVHSLNCLQTYPNLILVSDSTLCYLSIPRGQYVRTSRLYMLTKLAIDYSFHSAFILKYRHLFSVIILQITSTEEIKLIDVGEKECEKISQNSEMSENIPEQQEISKVHSLNCLQTYPNRMLVSFIASAGISNIRDDNEKY